MSIPVGAIGGRVHAAQLDAIVDAHGTTIDLRAPQPGWFIPAIGEGDLVTAGEVIGELVVLGRVIAIRVGNVRGIAAPPGAARPVAYGDVLLVVDLEATIANLGAQAAALQTAASAEHVFRAPTSGRFYSRPSPDKPAFVVAGTELAPGATICLLEVMKTFHRVTYAGEPTRVRAVLVTDGDDVNAGDPLVSLD